MHTELSDFMKMLKGNKENLTKQQYKTVRGQALSGDLEGARKGLAKLLKRRCG